MTNEQPCFYSRYGKNKCKHHFGRQQGENVYPQIDVSSRKSFAPLQCPAPIRFNNWNKSQPNDKGKTIRVNQGRGASGRATKRRGEGALLRVCRTTRWYCFIQDKTSETQQ